MRKFARSLAVIMAFAMAGSTVCAGSGAYGSAQRVYAAEVQNQEGQEEPVAEAQNQDDQEESVAELAAASGLGVAKHSKSDIIAQIKKNGAYPSDAVTYKKAYKTKSPYYEGALSDATLKKALATLNNVRYIAGLNYNVTLDSTYTAQCQAGAYVNYLIDDLTHDPRKPSGMSDALYKKGYAGCSSSNIAMGSPTLNSCILYSWMEDSDSSNIRYVGHRGWCLNPTMGKTGFGVAGIYMSMYALDMSNNSSIKNVAWPAQTMPLEYFGNDYAWSLFTGQNETESRVKVTLKRKSDGKTWSFSKGKANGDFYVSNDYQKGTIVFRPKGIAGYRAGDSFTVNVTGVNKPVTYTVTFFSLGEASHNHKLSLSASPNFNTMKATVTGKCNECNKSYKATTSIKITTSGVSCGYTGTVSYSYSGVVLNGKKYNGTGKAKVTSLPHMYGKPTFQWSGKSCTASRLCSRCKKTSKTACKVTSKTTATCTAAGQTTYTATYGSYSSTKKVAAAKLAHKFTKYTSDKNATCTKDGTKTAKCDYGCGTKKTVTDTGTKLAHKYTKYTSDKNATCMKDGTKTAKCDYGCGAVDTVIDKGSKIPHVYTKYVPNDDATCTADGTKTAHCDYGCGATDTVTDEGSMIPHVYTNYVSNEDATCMADGTKTAHCDYGCGATDTVTDRGSRLPHVFVNYVSNEDATCTADGTKTAHCDYGCGTTDTVTDEGTKIPHVFTDYVSNGDATCTADGTKTAHCDYGCGAADTITDKGSMLPHSLTDERIVTKKARVHSYGVVSGRCSECGKIIPTGKIAAIDKVVTNNSRMLYDGSEKTASVTAYDTDGEQIPRSQYILSYDDNISSGIVHVTMTFRGDYEGTLKGSFRIYPMSTSVKSVINVYGGMKLTWNKVPDGTGYVIYRNVNGGAYKRIKRISGIGLTTYTDTVARVNGNRYAYKIYVYRKSGDVTLFSTASSPKAAYHMAAPVIKQTSNLASGSLKITYTRNSKATGYQIQYADNAKFSGAKAVGVTGYNNLSKTITGLQKKTYYVRIRSFKKSGGVVSYSNWSSAKSVSVRK